MSSLDEAFLRQECEAAGLPWHVCVVEETASTSDDLRAAAVRGEASGQVLFAETQTAGRGRRDNRWITPPGQDLMFSLLLRPETPLPLWPRLTTLAALAICKAVEEELPLAPQIKWPNDLFLNGRKFSGLLAEAVSGPQGPVLVLGIGINVNSRTFPPELETTATSLLKALPENVLVKELDRTRLAAGLLRELHLQFSKADRDFAEAVDEVRERSWLLGRQIRALADGIEVYGRATDLTAEGHLMLTLPDGSLRTLTSAEGVRQVITTG